MNILSEQQILENLKNLNGWNYEKNSIHKIFELKNFSEAVSFVVKVGFESEKNDHHPDLFLHGWNKVTVTLSTHSEGGVTQKDFKLAQLIDKV